MPLSRMEIARDTTLYGMRSLTVAIGYFGLSQVLISLGSDEAASSSITTTTQGLVVGAGAGFITSIGGEISRIKGKYTDNEDSDEYLIEISKVIKTGLIKTIVLGGIGATICITARHWLAPILSNQETVHYAGDYLEMFAPAVLWDFLLFYSSQLVFKIEKNAWFGLLSTIAFRIPSIFLASYLAKNLNLGVKGVGLSSSIMGLVTVLLCSLWFCKPVYRKILGFDHYTYVDFKIIISQLFHKAWKLSAQRTTEWGNLFTIVQIVGAWSNDNLIETQPSILVINLAGQLVQGFSVAGLMIATEDAKALKQLKKNQQEMAASGLIQPLLGHAPLDQAQALTPLSSEIKSLKNKIKNNFWVGNGAGLGCNLLLVTALWSAKDSILDWTLPSDADEDVRGLANTLYLINLASTLGDTVRVITGGLLFSYDDLMFPILVSFISMTLLGVPLGLGIGLSLDNSIIPLFIMRLVTILIAAGMNVGRFFSFLNDDDKVVNHELLLTRNSAGFGYARERKSIPISSLDEMDIDISQQNQSIRLN